MRTTAVTEQTHELPQLQQYATCIFWRPLPQVVSTYTFLGRGIRFNHGGGYQYRIMKADAPLTEAEFQKTPLAFAGETHIYLRVRLKIISNF